MNAKVLIADDERSLAEMLAAILQQCGFTALVAHCSEKAFELALQERPAVALLDFRLPPGNGYELALRIREFLPETQIILSTGDPDSVPKEPFSIYGKPFHPTELLPFLPGLVNRYEELAQQIQSSTWEWEVESNSMRWAPSSADSFGEPTSVIDFDRWTQLVAPEEFPRVWAELQEAANTGRDYRTTYRIVRERHSFVIESRGKLYKDSSGRVRRILGTNYRRAS